MSRALWQRNTLAFLRLSASLWEAKRKHMPIDGCAKRTEEHYRQTHRNGKRGVGHVGVVTACYLDRRRRNFRRVQAYLSFSRPPAPLPCLTTVILFTSVCQTARRTAPIRYSSSSRRRFAAHLLWHSCGLSGRSGEAETRAIICLAISQYR